MPVWLLDVSLALAAGVWAGQQRVDPASCLLTMREIARWDLPATVREASGLAVVREGHLLVHGDEVASLLMVRTIDGTVTAHTRLGTPPLPGDFEAITMLGRSFYLLTSTGTLYRAELPATGALPASLRYQRIQPRLDRECEFEGLTTDPTPGVLLLACKTPYRKSIEGTVTLFRWDTRTQRLAQPDRLVVPAGQLSVKQFRTSDATRDPLSSQILLISALDQRLAVLAADGRPLGSRGLRARHRQPEGIAWLGSGRLAIADEGTTGSATLTIYQCGD